MRLTYKVLIPALTLATGLLVASQAHAGIGACGNIHVEAEAECEVKTGIECEASCEPFRFEAQCAANLSVECRGECNASADVGCTGSCEASCMGSCEANPAEFDCRGECVGSCTGQCDGRCADSECAASCEATCEGECSASCEATPPSASCEGQCAASCEGECRADVNVDCQVDCQSSGYASCQAELEGGCRASCETNNAGLYCDGQYVDHGGNLEECVNSLRAILNIEVTGYAEANCSGNKCEAKAGGSISCGGRIEPDSSFGDKAAFLGLGLFIFGAWRRRRLTA